jgi:adenylate kinase family enzyme
MEIDVAEMKRIAVIGNGGGGKSMLARRIGSALGIPVLVIDKIQFGPGLSRTPEPELHEIHSAELARDRWIIDGFGPWPAMERRFELADTIIFIDFLMWVHFLWAARRHQAHCDAGPNAPYGDLPEAPSLERMFAVLWKVHEEYTPRFREIFNGYRSVKNVVHLRSPEELDAFAERFGAPPA